MFVLQKNHMNNLSQYQKLQATPFEAEEFRYMMRNQEVEKPEEILYEMQLVESIRFTDTFAEHDTLTVDEKLVADPIKFFKLG
jgi:hypothetical protein